MFTRCFPGRSKSPPPNFTRFFHRKFQIEFQNKFHQKFHKHTSAGLAALRIDTVCVIFLRARMLLKESLAFKVEPLRGAPRTHRVKNTTRSKFRVVNLLLHCSERVQGATEWGQKDREPLRGKSASERVSERVSERKGFQRVCRGFQRYSEVFRGFQRLLEVFRDFSEVLRDFSEVFRGPLRDPLRGRFPSQEALSPVSPDRVAPWTFSKLWLTIAAHLVRTPFSLGLQAFFLSKQGRAQGVARMGGLVKTLMCSLFSIVLVYLVGWGRRQLELR